MNFCKFFLVAVFFLLFSASNRAQALDESYFSDSTSGSWLFSISNLHVISAETLSGEPLQVNGNSIAAGNNDVIHITVGYTATSNAPDNGSSWGQTSLYIGSDPQYPPVLSYYYCDERYIEDFGTKEIKTEFSFNVDLYNKSQVLVAYVEPNCSSWLLESNILTLNFQINGGILTKKPICPQIEKGSIIKIDNQTVGESIPIVGTDFSLNYTTERAHSFISAYKLHKNLVPGDGSFSGSLPVSVSVAGTSYNTTVSASPGTDFDYTWDGLDSGSSQVLTPQVAMISVGGGYPSSAALSAGIYDPQIFGMPGWTLSVHHYYNKELARLYKGDGSTVDLSSFSESGNTWVISQNGDEIYVFDSNGKHLETKSSFTGYTKYTFGYDGSDRLTSVTDAFGNQTTLNRTSGVLTSIQGPYGQTTTVSIGSNGLISGVTNPNSEAYAITYKTGTDLLETFTKPGGQVSTMTYNSDGELTKDQGNGGDFWSIVKTLNAATQEQTITKTSNLGRQSTYTALAETDGTYTSTLTDPSGLVHTTVQDPDNGIKNAAIVSTTTTTTNDERFGSKLKRIASLKEVEGSQTLITTYGQSVSYGTGITPGYFNFSSLEKTATKNSKVTTSSYTASTGTLVNTSPEGATLTSILNSYEQPTSVQVGSDTATTYSYDTHGRLSQEAQGTHNILSYAYNTAGFVSTITDALSHVTSYAYDLAGRVTSVTLPDSRVIGYGYDDNGNVTSVTPPSKPAHGFSFNAFETLDTYSPPTLTGVSVVNTTYTYNNDKQLTQITRPDTKTASFTYNSTTGLLTGLTIDTGSYSYTYKTNSDQYDVVSSPDGYNNTFSWSGYNLKTDSQKQTSTGNLYGKTTLAYDSEHRLSSRTIQGRSGATTYVRNYTYNDDDQPTQIGDETLTYEYPSGRLSTTTLGKISDLRTYDTYGNLATYTAIYTPTTGSPTTLYTYTLTRDLMSKITSLSETVLGTTTTWDYTYDDAGRLTQVLKNSAAYSSYTYDDNGNRTSGTTAGTSFTATYDDQDRILSYNSRTYSYNANGDITQYGSGTTNNTYTFDALGKLKAATTTAGANLAYSLDGLGRRIRKTDGGTFKYQYFYENGERIAAHVNNSGVIQKEYVYGVEHPNVPDYMVSGGVNYRIIKDHLGSPRLVVSAGNGTVAQQMDYDDLGNVVSDTNSGFQHFGFAGGNYDPQTKLTKFGAREYDARSAGRWMTKDPVRFEGGDTNLMGYVAQDPVNLSDPSGLATYMCTEPLEFLGGSGAKSGPDVDGNPLYHQFICIVRNGKVNCNGQTRSGGPFSPGKKSNDKMDNGVCEKRDNDNDCLEKCISNRLAGSRPYYSLINVGGSNCQKWSNDTLQECRAVCGF